MGLENFSQPSEVSRENIEELEGQKKYEINGEMVNVGWKIFPAKEKGVQGKAVLFIPGWSINERAKSIEILCEEFSNYSESPAYAVDARTDNVLPNSAEIQAEAIQHFIKERGLSDVTLVGNSLGGVEAIHLAALLQENDPDTNVEGLVLLDSMSLYDQTVPELVTGYGKDMANTQIDAVSVRAKRVLGNNPRIKESTATALPDQNKKYLGDGTAEVLKEIMHSNVDYPRRMMSELRQMTTKNSHLKDIRVPVVMIQGKHDRLSKPEGIIPENEHRENLRTREAFLKENVFINAPHVTMIIPEKLGNHNLMYARSEEVAKSSLYMLERWNRKQNTAKENEK